MASPPIYSRQPPDGHEFPDYEERQHEDTSIELQPSLDHDTIDSLDNLDMQQEVQSIASDVVSVTESVNDDIDEYPQLPTTQMPTLPNKSKFTANCDIELRSSVARPEVAESAMTVSQIKDQRSSLIDLDYFSTNKQLRSSTTSVADNIFATPRLHSRSQSLVDISKPDRWSQIMEQRQRGLSKLKGLVIPEHVPSEPINTPAYVCDLPEITSSTTIPKLSDYPPIPTQPTVTKTVPSQRASINLPSPIWKQQEANVASALPKYSPAFKRRSLQLYTNGNLMQRSSPTTVPPTTQRFSTGFIYPESEAQTPPIISSSEDGVSSERNSSLPSLNDSDNDSAFKSCESLHSLENITSTQKDIDTVNKRNSHQTPIPVHTSAASIYQKTFDLLKHHNSQEGSAQLKSYRVNSGDTYNLGKLKQNILKANGNAIKTEMSSKFESNSHVNTPNRTVPKSMQSKPVASVNDLRKKFQAPDTIPFVKVKSSRPVSLDFPPITNPATPALKRFSSVAKHEAPVPTPVPIKEEINQILTTQDTQVVISKVKSEFGENIGNKDCYVAKLKPEIPGGSLGLTLAGGADYEAKEITVYSIRPGSVASKETKLKKGDQILSINGKVMKNLTHADTTALLKESKSEFEIVYCSRNELISLITVTPKRNSRRIDLPSPNENDGQNTPLATATNIINKESGEVVPTPPSQSSSIDVTIVKTSGGLGFSIAGGVDSPTGDLPLIVKKVFAGGAAEKSGLLHANDELLSIGDVNVTAMSRLDVWTMMKKLPEGPVNLKVRR